VVREWYRYQDELLGQLLEEIDLSRTAVFVVSDHGFKTGDRRIRSETTVDVRRAHLDHEPNGIFVAAGPHLRAGARVEGVSVLDLAPTVLHYLGFPVGRDMDGKVVEDAFDEEWRREHPIRYVETYERPKKARPGAPSPAPASPTQQTDADAARNLEALQALGYVEGPSGGGEVAGAAGESSPELNNNMGRIHLRNGDLQAAAAAFARALELDGRNAEALIGLGSVERARGNSEAAIHYVQRALQVDPSSVSALSELAELERDRGRLDDAIRLLQEALAIDDAQPWLHLGYGDVLQRAGRYPEALKAFELVLQLDPDSFKARYNLGVTYTNMGRLDDAERLYLEALEKSPKDPEVAKAHNNLGDIYLRRGDVAKARERFRSAVDGSPVNLEARYNLAMLEMEEGGDLQRAVTLLEEAARLQPNHEQVTVRLGMAYLRAGRAEDSHRSFLLVRRLYPQNWVAPLGLALVFAANEQPDEAKKHLGEAVRLGGDRARQAASGYPLLEKLGGGR
jgi:tetratricopeptide (TPR) repeat protein